MFEALVVFWTGLSLIGKIGMGAAAFVVGMALTAAVLEIRQRQRRNEFWITFGVYPEDEYNAMRIQLPKIKRELELLARNLSRLFAQEQSLSEYSPRLRGSSRSYEVEEDLEKWKQLREEIKYAKDEFWRAYNLAKKDFGYPIEGDSWKDFVK